MGDISSSSALLYLGPIGGQPGVRLPLSGEHSNQSSSRSESKLKNWPSTVILLLLLLLAFIGQVLHPALLLADSQRSEQIVQLDIPRYGGSTYACRYRLPGRERSLGHISNGKWRTDNVAKIRAAIKKQTAIQKRKSNPNLSTIERLRVAGRKLTRASQRCNTMSFRLPTATPTTTATATPPNPLLTPTPDYVTPSPSPTAIPIASSTPTATATSTPAGVYTTSLT